MIRKKSQPRKQQIISEYLSGDASFKTLSERYGINLRTIQSWVRSFRKGNSIEKPNERGKNLEGLKAELEQAQLKNELLEEILRLSEEQTGIDFRKKFGTRRS